MCIGCLQEVKIGERVNGQCCSSCTHYVRVLWSRVWAALVCNWMEVSPIALKCHSLKQFHLPVVCMARVTSGEYSYAQVFVMSSYLLALCSLVTGISGKSQVLFALVFTTRYLDLLTSFISLYNTTMKVKHSHIALYSNISFFLFFFFLSAPKAVSTQR